MPLKANVTMFALAAALAVPFCGAQDKAPVTSASRTKPAGSVGAPGEGLDRAKTLKAAADALGMPRWSQVGGGRLPAVDVVNTVEFWGAGTSYAPGPAKSEGSKTEYHGALRYNTPAMRVETTRANADGSTGAAAQHTIEVVSDKYAWNESELGGGLVPGKGTATPMMTVANQRLLQLWMLPYGVIKACLAAGDKTKVSMEGGATSFSCALPGQLSGITVKATLNEKNQVAKVEARGAGAGGMLTGAEYSEYGDLGDIPTDVLFPAHIVEKQDGRPLLDIRVKKADANNPYLVFPVPGSVKAATP
jgi:hypothetical protein